MDAAESLESSSNVSSGYRIEGASSLRLQRESVEG